MALNNEYFDSIRIEIAKKKYYNAGKVDALLADIRRQALDMCAENEYLRAKLDEISKGREDITETLLSARSFSRSIIDDSNRKAEEITAAAEKRAEEISAEAKRHAEEIIAAAEQRAAEIEENNRSVEDYAISNVRESYETLRESLQAQLELVNNGWQSFLANFSSEDIPAEVPEDLSDKVSLIADELLYFDDLND